MDELQAQYEQAYQLAKLQAATDGAFDEDLMKLWFAAAWNLCARMIGYTPRQQIKESICINECGTFSLSHRPTSEVKIYDGYTLIATLPPSLKIERCTPALCCLCHPYAEYMIGSEPGCEFPATFVLAVCRLFAYLVENRGDSEMDPQVLSKCGAMTFLAPGLTYVL